MMPAADSVPAWRRLQFLRVVCVGRPRHLAAGGGMNLYGNDRTREQPRALLRAIAAERAFLGRTAMSRSRGPSPRHARSPLVMSLPFRFMPLQPQGVAAPDHRSTQKRN